MERLRPLSTVSRKFLGWDKGLSVDSQVSLVTTLNLQSDWLRALVFEFKFEVPACRYFPFLRFYL